MGKVVYQESFIIVTQQSNQRSKDAMGAYWRHRNEPLDASVES